MLATLGALRRRNVNANASTVRWYFAAAGARREDACAADANGGFVDIDARARGGALLVDDEAHRT